MLSDFLLSVPLKWEITSDISLYFTESVIIYEYCFCLVQSAAIFKSFFKKDLIKDSIVSKISGKNLTFEYSIMASVDPNKTSLFQIYIYTVLWKVALLLSNSRNVNSYIIYY